MDGSGVGFSTINHVKGSTHLPPLSFCTARRSTQSEEKTKVDRKLISFDLPEKRKKQQQVESTIVVKKEEKKRNREREKSASEKVGHEAAASAKSRTARG